MRPGGKDGFLYENAFGTKMVAAEVLTAGNFYRVEARGGTSVIPAGPDVGEFFIAPSALTLAAGDEVTPITLTKLSFVTDDEDSSSVNKYEDTTQIDDVRAYAQGTKPETTGSVTGYYEVGSAQAELIENHFKVILTDDGAGNITRKAISGDIFHAMLSRRESTEVGEIEVWEYKPMLVDQLSQGKPMDGNQSFKFNYTVNGKYKPFVYKRTVPV